MKNISNLLTLLTALLLLGACEKDGDKFFLSTPEENELIASTDAIILKEETAKLYAMSLAWTEQTLQISDARYEPTSGIETTVQASLSEDFSGNVQESVESGLSKSYTVAALNVVAYRLGVTEIKATPIYFRLAARNGSNTDPIYSNTVKVMVTPYSIDMRYATLVSGGDNPIAETTVYSANADGIYQGFAAAKSWGSFFLQESDETLWYTVENSPFMLSTSGSWSQWLPKYAGSYFLNFNTTQKLWTALHIPTLEVSGIDGLTMKYSQEDNQWKGVFNGTEGNSYSIQLKGTGWLFTTNSVEGGKINDDKYKETPFVFGGTADQLTFSTEENATAGTITVSVPATGECTFVIDLNDPTKWTVSVTEGGSTEPTYPEYLEMQGVGTWWEQLYRKLESCKTAGIYRTVFQTVSNENFQIVDPSTNIWYGSDQGNLYNLVPTNEEHNDIWFDSSDKKSYTIEVDYINLTWKPTEIKQINVYGTFNEWNEDKDLMTYNKDTGIWSAECDITTIGDGFYFLINTDPSQLDWEWRLYYTPESGLYLSDQNGDNIKPTKEGKYLITLDLNKMEFTMTEIIE